MLTVFLCCFQIKGQPKPVIKSVIPGNNNAIFNNDLFLVLKRAPLGRLEVFRSKGESLRYKKTCLKVFSLTAFLFKKTVKEKVYSLQIDVLACVKKLTSKRDQV